MGVAHDGGGDHHPLFRLSLMDMTYQGDWSWQISAATSAKIHAFLVSMERLTWFEIWNQMFNSKLSASKKHKFIPAGNLAPAAQKRLRELGLDEWDHLFRFRLGNMERLWGVISEESPRVFYPIWWDPDHKVCPSKDR